ncbi:MAG: ribonuclease HII [Saprospiraceae bacterium]|nr:ribonuclease HII [Saprospiraceae bacterium]
MNKLRSYYKKNQYEAGCDEAGRGCLAGPVVAAAVILDPDRPIKNLQDSKKLTENQRLSLRDEILEKAKSWSVQTQSPQEIDHYNILQASLRAMALCVQQLSPMPALVLVDGNKPIPISHIPQMAIVRGDGIYQSIAAASILAKTYRDAIMIDLHREYEGYGWHENKGYPTAFHREAIKLFGLSPHHRRSFKCFESNPQEIHFPV